MISSFTVPTDAAKAPGNFRKEAAELGIKSLNNFSGFMKMNKRYEHAVKREQRREKHDELLAQRSQQGFITAVATTTPMEEDRSEARVYYKPLQIATDEEILNGVAAIHAKQVAKQQEAETEAETYRREQAQWREERKKKQQLATLTAAAIKSPTGPTAAAIKSPTGPTAAAIKSPTAAVATKSQKDVPVRNKKLVVLATASTPTSGERRVAAAVRTVVPPPKVTTIEQRIFKRAAILTPNTVALEDFCVPTMVQQLIPVTGLLTERLLRVLNMQAQLLASTEKGCAKSLGSHQIADLLFEHAPLKATLGEIWEVEDVAVLAGVFIWCVYRPGTVGRPGWRLLLVSAQTTTGRLAPNVICRSLLKVETRVHNPRFDGPVLALRCDPQWRNFGVVEVDDLVEFYHEQYSRLGLSFVARSPEQLAVVRVPPLSIDVEEGSAEWEKWPPPSEEKEKEKAEAVPIEVVSPIASPKDLLWQCVVCLHVQEGDRSRCCSCRVAYRITSTASEGIVVANSAPPPPAYEREEPVILPVRSPTPSSSFSPFPLGVAHPFPVTTSSFFSDGDNRGVGGPIPVSQQAEQGWLQLPPSPGASAPLFLCPLAVTVLDEQATKPAAGQVSDDGSWFPVMLARLTVADRSSLAVLGIESANDWAVWSDDWDELRSVLPSITAWKRIQKAIEAHSPVPPHW